MSTATALDLTGPLSVLLREGSMQAHAEAENSQGIRLLLGGKLPKDEYVRFLMVLWYLYDALEAALDKHASYPTLEPTNNPTLLARAPALAADIAYLLDVSEDSWKSHPVHQELATPSLPRALQAYLARIQTLADSPDPSPLLAHSYVRYLGDLSGGQTIRRVVAKAYGLGEGGAREQKELGVSFYVFKELGGEREATMGDRKRIKEWFKEGVNVAGESCADDTVKLAIVEETSHAYRLIVGLLSTIRMPARLQDDDLDEFQPTTVLTGPAPSSSSTDAGGTQRSGCQWLTLGSVTVTVVVAMCAAHFVLVVGGYIGNRG